MCLDPLASVPAVCPPGDHVAGAASPGPPPPSLADLGHDACGGLQSGHRLLSTLMRGRRGLSLRGGRLPPHTTLPSSSTVPVTWMDSQPLKNKSAFL